MSPKCPNQLEIFLMHKSGSSYKYDKIPKYVWITWFLFHKDTKALNVKMMPQYSDKDHKETINIAQASKSYYYKIHEEMNIQMIDRSLEIKSSKSKNQIWLILAILLYLKIQKREF